MATADENAPEQSSDPLDPDELLRREQELLAKARETTQRITKRVRRALEDRDQRGKRSTEEEPPA
jgi:hypothetical protein